MAESSLQGLAQLSTSRWGAAAARAGGPGDAIDECAPLLILEPPDVPTLADMLAWANKERLVVVPRGGSTKIAWGTTPSSVDIVLSTACLVSPIDHCAGDLTATVPAGATLAAVNQTLARERQWLALDPPFADRATIGGIVATNDSGPRRHRYGTPRDLIIGVEMALAGGRVSKAGGKVVKNVAGYDLARLLCGSFGSLAIITHATFKLAPAPPASTTVLVSAPQAGTLAELALAVAAAPLTPSAIEIEAPGARLLIRFETTEGAADRQAAATCALCAGRGVDAQILKAEAETTAWRDYERRLSPPQAAVARLAVLPTQVGDVLEHVTRVAGKRHVNCVIGGRVALGVLVIAVTGPSAEAVATTIDELRRNAWARGGSVVVRSAPADVKALVEVWGDVGDGWPIMQSVKMRFDPNRILNPGRGPGGL